MSYSYTYVCMYYRQINSLFYNIKIGKVITELTELSYLNDMNNLRY